MKISRDVEIFIYRGVVIIFDFIFLLSINKKSTNNT